MNLIILDKDFKPIAPVNALQSLIWDRRYREAGSFEIHAGPEDFEAIRSGAYLYRDDRDEFGILSVADIRRNKAGAKTCYGKGYFGEAMLDNRVLDRTQRLSGTPEEIARELVRLYFIDTAGAPGDYDGRSLRGRLELGDMSGEAQDPVTWQGTGSPVGQSIYELEAGQSLSHRLSYDYKADRVRFRVWRGKDRNAMLSDRFGNLTETSYHRDATDAPNVIFIAGSGEGAARKVYRLDIREPGQDAREMYVDARDLQQEYVGEDGQSYKYTDEDYDALLENRGRQKAAEHQAQERFEAAVDGKANLVYRVDYDVGDICKASIDGVELVKQITGIREIYEAGSERLEVTLGDYGPTSIQDYVARRAQVNSSAGPAPASVGDLSKLTTEDKSGLVPAVNELDKDIGDLAGLKTDKKESLVEAVNEVDASVGALGDLGTEEKGSLVGALNELDGDVGNLDELQTHAKGSLVEAINEIASGGGGGGGGGEGGNDPRIGNMADLKTDAKDLVVDAINELHDSIGDTSKLETGKGQSLVDAVNGLVEGGHMTPEQVEEKAVEAISDALDDPQSGIYKKIADMISEGGGGGGGGGDTDWDQYDLPWYEDFKGKAGAGVDAIYRYLRPSDWMPMPTPERFEGYFLMLIPADAPARLTVGVNNSTARVELGYVSGGAFVPMEEDEVSHGFGTQDYTFDVGPRSWCPRTSDGFFQMMVKISTPYVQYEEETGYYTGRAYLGTLHAACTVEASVFDLDFPSGGMTSLRFIDVREGNANFSNLSTNLPHLLVVRQEGRSFPGGSSSLVAGFFDGYTSGQDRYYTELINTVSTANCPRLLCIETGALAKYDGAEAFRGNYSLRYLGDVTIESTNAGYLFSGCTSLTRIGNISAPKATGAAYMFENCGNLRKVGNIDLPLVTAAAYFGSGPDAIETVGDVYMPKCGLGTYFFGGTALREVGDVVVGSGNNMFNGRSGLRSVGAIEVTTTASCASMFDGCANLRRIGSISMPENTACNRMFYNCSALSSPPAIIAGTVSNAENMYYGCAALEELPETPIADRATSCANMFYRAGIRKIESLDLPTASSTSGMFQYCQRLEIVGEVHIGKNLTAAANASRMFGNCTRLETAGDIYFDGKPTSATAYHNAESIFQSCYLLRAAGKVTSAAPISLYNAFYACHRLEEAAGVQTDTEAVTANITSFRLGYMFRGLHNLQRVGDIDAPGVYDTAYMFSNCDGLNDFGRLSLGKSTAVNMFESCTAIKELEPFDVPPGANISYMFNGCVSLTRSPVRNTGEASDITRLFYGCSDLEHAGTISDAGMSGTTAVSPFENCFRLHDVALEPTRPVGWTLYGLLQRDQLADFIRALPEKTTSGSAIIDMQNVMASAYLTTEELAELTGKGYTYRVAELYEP